MRPRRGGRIVAGGRRSAAGAVSVAGGAAGAFARIAACTGDHCSAGVDVAPAELPGFCFNGLCC
jgi:hypothetical protein